MLTDGQIRNLKSALQSVTDAEKQFRNSRLNAADSNVNDLNTALSTAKAMLRAILDSGRDTR